MRGVSAGDEIAVVVSASTVTGSTAGAEFNIVGDKVTVKSAKGAGAGWLSLDGAKSVTFAGPPTPLTNGVYGTVTLTVNAGVTADMAFSVGVSDFVAYNADGTKTDVAAGAALMVNKASPTLTADATSVMIPLDGSAGTATVTAAGFDGTVTYTGASEDGTVSATEAGDVTVTATDGIDPETPSVTISFIATPYLTASSSSVTISHGDTGSATVTVMDAADGADISITVDGDGVTFRD